MMLYLIRIVLTFTGFIVATAAATGFVSIASFIHLTQQTGIDAAGIFIFNFFLGTALVASVAILPAIVVILTTEIIGIRSFYFHVGVCGALGGLAAVGAGGLLGTQENTAFFQTVWLAAGFLGGLVYWAIAGRGAGIVRDARREPPEVSTQKQP